PPGLVIGAYAGAIIAMEVLEEHNVLFPFRIRLQFFRATEDRTAPVLILEENTRQPAGNFPGYLEEVHLIARTGGTFDLKAVSVVEVVTHQRPNQENIHRHPDRSAPIGVSAEQTCVGLRRYI